MIEGLRKFLMGLAFSGLLFLPGCPPKPPTPTPTPTPDPTVTPAKGVPVGEGMLLTTRDARLFVGDQPFDAFMALPCCMGEPTGMTNHRWPLASEEWMDFTRPYGANMYHFRLGPFYAGPDQEPRWMDTGGPYLADGPDFNPLFWQKVRDLAYYALRHDAYVEVNIIDTWYCKHAQWGDQKIPWPELDVDSCGRRASPEQERYLRKAVEELGCFGNLIWLDGNEASNIQGYDPAWSTWVRDIIRDEEAKSGCGFTHLFGTNAPNKPTVELVDYVATHNKAALTEPIAGRWTIQNEHNPAWPPATEISYFAQARAKGLAWAFWRAEMPEPQMMQTLEGIRQVIQGTTPSPACIDGTTLAEAACEGPLHNADVLRATTELGDLTGQDPMENLRKLRDKLLSYGLCAIGGEPGSEAVFIRRGDGLVEENHAVFFGNGSWTGSGSGKFIGCFTAEAGPAPTPEPTPPPEPPSNCSKPKPPEVSTFNIKCGDNRKCDATQLYCNQAYCAALGMGDKQCCPARNYCPGVKCEEREACEAIAGYLWRCEVGDPVAFENPAQGKCREGSWIEVCTANNTACTRKVY